MSTERQALADAIATAQSLLAKRQELTAQADHAAETARAAQAELATLEAEADAAARSAVTNGDTATVDGIEARIAACKRRVAAAEAVHGELAAKLREGQATIEQAQERAAWAARAVLAEEGEHLFREFEQAQRRALTLKWQCHRLLQHFYHVRTGAAGKGYSSFDVPERYAERLRVTVAMDETERWNLNEFDRQWAAFEAALLADPDAPAPEGLS